jgi:ribonuclease HI
MSRAQDALYNDQELWEFDLILMQEPHYCDFNGNIHITGIGANFEVIKPKINTSGDQDSRIRSCIWAHRNNEYIQLPTDDNDSTIIILQRANRNILVASIYIPSNTRNKEEDEYQLACRMQELQRIIDREKSVNPRLEILIAGDFNRHDSLWGGPSVALEQRQGEGAKVIDFLEQNNLQLLAPRGVATWERGEWKSTIDLIMASERLSEDTIKCKIWDNEYGSDHRAIHTAISMDQDQELPQVERYLIQKADWKAVRETIKQTLVSAPFPTSNVEEMQQYIQHTTEDAIEQHCPKAKPSTYGKRWWTPDLTALRRNYTWTRNIARSRRRQGNRDANLEAATKMARHDFHHAIKKQKKQHWNEFLDDAKNIWKATRYLNPGAGSSFGRIAAIKDQRGEVTQDKPSMAKELLASFFPPPPEPQQPDQTTDNDAEQFLLRGLTSDEIERALSAANPDRAAGRDGLTIRVWREVWPVLQHQICQLFSASLSQGKLPQDWKVAKIIPLKKSGKDDYTLPKNYRPISLLATLGKVMEAVIATRIAYLTEVHKLLPNNHFGARKQKSTIHAISYLQESVFNAWRGKKTLSLVSFDVKGAYNNVATEPLLQRLRQRRIPEPIIKWVRDFCTNRKACVMVNGFTSEVEDLPQAGLPQGSPLAPILFLFFNANLVQHKVREGGSMAFVDDYTAWVVGDSAERNTRRIQREILPQLGRWEKESGAVFESSKTAFIHFTRSTLEWRDSDMPLRFKQDIINPSRSVKILGVIMDQELRYKEHIAGKADKAFKAALALKRLQGLRPSSMRQLFSATVAPVMDYASPIWYLAISDKTLAKLERAQRIAAQAIIGGFKTMGLNAAVMEAGIPTLRQRLHEQTLRFWMGIHKLDDSHIHHKLAKYKGKKRFSSPLRKAAVLFRNLKACQADKIPAVGYEPWAPKAHVHILDREGAKQATATEYATVDFYTDGSVRNGRAGIGIWTSTWEMSKLIGREEDTNAHHTELLAIWMVIKGIPNDRSSQVRIRVFSDSQSALQSIQNSKVNDSINLVLKIREKIRNATISLHWVPGHEGIMGNERANELAQMATADTQPMPPPAETVPISVIYARGKVANYTPKQEEFYGAKTGKFLQKIDKALPGKHTKKLYNSLNRVDAAILAQLRTNISRLNTYLYKIKVAETDKCECGALETVQHFLFLCPRWRQKRQGMRAAHGNRYCNISYALGGYSDHRENGKIVNGEKDKWKPDWNAVKATIEFAKATGRLQTQI